MPLGHAAIESGWERRAGHRCAPNIGPELTTTYPHSVKYRHTNTYESALAGAIGHSFHAQRCSPGAMRLSTPPSLGAASHAAPRSTTPRQTGPCNQPPPTPGHGRARAGWALGVGVAVRICSAPAGAGKPSTRRRWTSADPVALAGRLSAGPIVTVASTAVQIPTDPLDFAGACA